MEMVREFIFFWPPKSLQMVTAAMKLKDARKKSFDQPRQPHDWNGQFSFQIPKKGNAKECSNYCTIALISHASKVMLKIIQARLQPYVNHELPDVQAGFRKGRGIRDQIANIHWIIKIAREFQKNFYFCFIDYAKASDYVNHPDGNTRPPDLPLEKSVCRSGSNS